ncbi:MAG: hypothetical protein QME96_17440 [Myxococcota bacterium]|nr:hypothetical protein [Myxococcota bacterium]
MAAVQADEQIRGAIDATEAAQVERRRRRVETAERRDEMARRIAESRAAAADAAGALARVSSRLTEERTRADALRAEIEGLRVALADGDATVQERRIEVERAASRLASLVEIIDRHEAYGAGVRALLDRATAPDVPRMFPLGDLVSCEDGYEAALAAALGDTLQRLVCDLRGDADEALRYLREAALGRAAVTPREGWVPADAGAKCSAPPGAEPLSERVRAEAPVADLVAAALSGVFVVSSLREAEALRAADHRAVFVTRSGELLHPDGTMCGGSAEDRFASFLHAKSERSLLEGALPSLRAVLDAALAGQESLRARLRDVRGSFDAASAAAHQAEVEATRVAADLAATEEAGRRSMEDAAEADALVQRLDAGIAEADGAIAGLLTGRETAARRLAAVDGAVAEAAERVLALVV